MLYLEPYFVLDGKLELLEALLVTGFILVNLHLIIVVVFKCFVLILFLLFQSLHEFFLTFLGRLFDFFRRHGQQRDEDRNERNLHGNGTSDRCNCNRSL